MSSFGLSEDGTISLGGGCHGDNCKQENTSNHNDLSLYLKSNKDNCFKKQHIVDLTPRPESRLRNNQSKVSYNNSETYTIDITPIYKIAKTIKETILN